MIFLMNYHLVMSTVCELENGPVEIVDLPSYKMFFLAIKIYHLVMTFTVRELERSTMLLSSVFTIYGDWGHGFHGKV